MLLQVVNRRMESISPHVQRSLVFGTPALSLMHCELLVVVVYAVSQMFGLVMTEV